MSKEAEQLVRRSEHVIRSRKRLYLDSLRAIERSKRLLEDFEGSRQGFRRRPQAPSCKIGGPLTRSLRGALDFSCGGKRAYYAICPFLVIHRFRR